MTNNITIPKELIEQFGYNELLNKNTTDFFLSLTKANIRIIRKGLEDTNSLV